MRNVIDDLKYIESAPLGNERLEALKFCDSPDMRKILNYALSPQITFGIKQLPTNGEVADLRDSLSGDMGSFEGFYKDEADWLSHLYVFLDRLAAREVTGNDAKKEVIGFLAKCPSWDHVLWSSRIIRQDLRLNIGPKEVNNVFGLGTIFQFKVSLAEKTLDSKGNWTIDDEDLKGRWLVEPKLDGARCVAYLPSNNGPVKLYSRTGKEWKNFESIRLKLQEINRLRNQTTTIVLDGEVVSYVEDRIDFQALQSTLFRKDGVEEGCLKYMLFDAAHVEEWENPKAPYANRYAKAKEFVLEARSDVPGSVNKLGIVEAFVVTDPTLKQAIQYNLDFAKKGFEGAMLRVASDAVVMKRSKKLLKFKTFVDDEAEVIGVTDGTGNREGLVGAVQCRAKNGKEFACGSGFTQKQLEELTKLAKKKKLPKTLTYKYQPPLTDDGLPRFPIFKGFRHGDDIGSEG